MTRTVTDGVISEALVAARRHDGAITVLALGCGRGPVVFAGLLCPGV